MHKNIIYENLGLTSYKDTWDYQEELFQEVISAKRNGDASKEQYILFCEHNHVYTLGKSGDRSNLLIAEHVCKSKNIDFFPIDRGGDITYHGPGQLVVYPIIDLDEFGIGIKSYISMIEDVVIDVLNQYGIKGEKDEKAMGVWIEKDTPTKARKICAIGVKASRFVTMHGLALNVNADLSYFNYINPCGFTDKAVTSMQQELGKEVDFEDVSEKMKDALKKIFNIEYKTTLNNIEH